VETGDIKVDKSILAQAEQVIARLERLSVDSHWAIRASGLRRSLMRCVDEIAATRQSPDGQKPGDQVPDPQVQKFEMLADLVKRGYFILENAAREMGDRK